jgi:hypothetical protein
MKRTFIAGILSAGMVAASLVARGTTPVYSINIPSYVNTTFSSEAKMIWEIGPFAIGEACYWPKGNGYELNGEFAGAPRQVSTYFDFGKTSFSVPLSPRRTATVGATLLFAFSIVFGGLVTRRCFKYAAR